ncbi:MAG: uroporphyrinogen-III synthase [Boseongicola sp.]|nr:uroporphyrinogen-III synthase [Boseongicola sp.]MDD9979358.1 uroporphyrinogen-III synthase [Boseongicola sp.]
MADQSPVLLLSRPAARSHEFLKACEERLGREIAHVISPVFEIEPVGPVPDTTDYKTVIFTSGNAVRRMGLAGKLQGQKVATVGEETGRLSRSFGADAVTLGANVEEFLANSRSLEGPCVHLRGRHARGDLAQRLTESGIGTDDIVVYEQVPQDLTEQAKALIQSGATVIAPVFSPRSARLLSELLADEDRVTAIAISPAAANEWTGRGQILVAEAPTFDAMVEAVTAAL